MKSVTKAVLLAIVVALVGVGGFAFVSVQRAFQAVDDCYMQEHVAAVLIEHLQRNEGRWPTSWNDLQGAREICEANSSGHWSIAELREHVSIDFNADASKLAKVESNDEDPPYRMIWLNSGAKHHWSGGEPNRIVHNYLRRALNGEEDHQWSAQPVASESNARKALLARGATWRLDDRGHVIFVQMGSLKGIPQFADADLAHVAALTELTELNLSNSSITDEGLKSLSKLTHLRSLDLAGTKVTDAGMKHLTSLQELRALCLAFTRLTDAALPAIVQLSSLESLNLNVTDVSDDGAEVICSMQRLNDILLGDSQVTVQGADRLTATFPNARLYWSTRPK